MADENKEPVRLVYLGRRWAQKMGKKKPEISYSWAPEDKIIPNGPDQISDVLVTSIFGKLKVIGMRPGMSWVFDVIRSDDGGASSVTLGSGREPGRWGNTLDVAKWETLDREAYAKSQEDSVTKRLAKEGGLDEMLEDVRKVYRRLSPMQRSTFLVMLIDTIRKDD